MMRQTKMLGAALVGSVLLGGCQTYRETAPETVRPGTAVRITVDRDRALEIARETGVLRTRLTGTATDRSDDRSLALTFRAPGEPAFNTFAAVPWDDVIRVERRVFSPLRTAGLAALGAGVVLAILEVTEGGSDGDGGETPPTNEQVSIPLLRVGW